MRYRRHDRLDVWPLIADTFLGILAVVLFLTADFKAPDRKIEEYKKAIAGIRQRYSSIVDTVEISQTDATFVFSEQSLSFSECEWSLSDDRQESIRQLFRELGEGARRELIRLIRIEGHSDRRRLMNCPDVVPFLDNLQLSQNRARAVYNVLLGLSPTQRVGLQDVLEERGDPPPTNLEYIRRLNRDGRILVAGFGDRLPRDKMNPLAAVNRRVEVVIEFRQ